MLADKESWRSWATDLGLCCENLKLSFKDYSCQVKVERTPQLAESRHPAAENQAAVDQESIANATQAGHLKVSRISIKTLVCLQYGRIWFII